MKISYIANILPVVDSDLTITIDNSYYNSKYIMISLTLQYTILSSDAGGSMVLIPRVVEPSNGQYIKDGTNSIKEGQIIDLYKMVYEDPTKQPTPKRALLGFITAIQYRKSNNGVILVVNFKQLLSQFIMLPVGQTPVEKKNIGVTNVAIISNKANVEQITNGSIKTSLMDVAQGKNLYEDSSNPNVFNISKYLPEEVLIYSDLNTSRDTLLRQAIAPYNMVMFQNEDGTVDIDLLSINRINNDWTVRDGEFQSIQVDNAAGITINTLNQYYMIPALLETFKTSEAGKNTPSNFVVKPIAKWYPRENELFNTGNFTYGKLLSKSIDPNIIKNPKDFTYLTEAKNKNTIEVDGQTVPIAQLYAQQEYAKILTPSHTASVVYAMTPEMLALKLPLGDIINLYLTDNILYNNQMLCHSVTIMWGVDTGATLMLELSNLLSITGIWGED